MEGYGEYVFILNKEIWKVIMHKKEIINIETRAGKSKEELEEGQLKILAKIYSMVEKITKEI